MHVLVPLKLLEDAKQRLGGSLSAAERRAMTLAMAADVLSAVAGSRSAGSWTLISRNPEADALTEHFGGQRFVEPATCNLPGALHAAIADLPAAQRAGGILVLPADLPLLTALDIDCILDAHQALAAQGPACTLVADAALIGTNALALTPADAMQLIFDGQSYRPHLRAAIRHGLLVQTLRLGNFGLDIDTPGDLEALLEVRPNSHAGRCLRELRAARS
ncbi:MAG: 2-phospho-L-lactate guanylyltransferase [Pseudomonadota bacterium]